MPIRIALIISVLFQFTAAIIAVTLIRRTRTNVAWWLISAAYLLMALRRFLELIHFQEPVVVMQEGLLRSWIGVAISVLMLLSTIFIKRIFDVQRQVDYLQKENEAKVLQAVIQTEERERQRFAKELHDGLGPLLSSIKMAFSAIIRKMPPEEDRHLIDNTSKLINESITTIKEISNNLSPHVLKHFGFVKAVDRFIENSQHPEGPNITFSPGNISASLKEKTALVLYRVVCELISNALKHAHATQVNIDVAQKGDFILLDYYDNGRGLTEEMLEESEGMGLPNIISRVKSLNGSIHFSGNPIEGTTITIRVING